MGLGRAKKTDWYIWQRESLNVFQRGKCAALAVKTGLGKVIPLVARESTDKIFPRAPVAPLHDRKRVVKALKDALSSPTQP